MKNLRILLALMMIELFFSPQLKAATKTASNGVWTVAGIWSPSGVPAAGDNVVIPSGITVTLAGFGNCASLNITGTLKFASGSYLNYTGNSAPVIFGQLFCTATGSTFEFSNSATFTLPDIDFYNLLLSAGTKETDPSSARSILGNLSLTGGSMLSLYANGNFYPITIAGNVAGDGQLSLNLDNGGNATDVYVGGDYLCSGPIDLAGGNMYYYRTGISQLLQADGNGYNGSIILSGGPKVFIGDIIANDLVMNGNIVFSTTGLASSLTLNNLTASGTIDMSSGGVAHYLEIDGTITGCFSLIAGTGSEVAYGYPGTQKICPNAYNKLTLSPAGTNKILTGNTTVNGVLYLGAILSVNGNNLWIGASGSIFNTGFGSGKKIAFSNTGTDKLYLQGNVNTDFTNKIYPFGFSGTDYEPVVIYALSANVSPASSIGIRPVKTVLGAPYVNRMYSVTSTGITSITLFDALFTFLTTEATNFPGYVQRSAGGVLSTVIGSTITFSGAGGSPTTGAFGIHTPNNQINGDYFLQGNGPALYKSNSSSMNWSNASSWQQTFNNGVTWNTALNYPGQLSSGDQVSIAGSNVVTGDVSPDLLAGISISGQLLTGANNYSISGFALINTGGVYQTNTSATKTYFVGQLQNNGQFLCGANSYQEFRNGFINNGSALANFSPDGHTKFTTNNQTVSGTSTFSQLNGLVEVDINIIVENQHTYVYVNTNTSLIGLNASSGWQLGINGYMYSTSNIQLMTGGMLLATLPGTGVVYLGNNQKMRNTNYYDIQIGNPGVKIVDGQINTVDFGNNAGFATLSFSGSQLSTLSVTGSFYFDNPTDAVDMSGGGFAHQLYLGGFNNTITGATTIGNGKVIYNGNASQNVMALNYNTLVFEGTGTKFLTDNTKASQLHLGMANGVIQLGAFNLTTTGVFSDQPYSANNMIQMDGTSTAGAFFYNPATAAGLVATYPIGTGTDYTPVSITSINAASASANPIVSMQLVLGTGGSGILNRFVNFSTAGINTVSNLNLFIFYIDPTDVSGAIPSGVNIYNPLKTPLPNYVVLATYPNYFGQVGAFGNKIDGLWVAESIIPPTINFSGFVTTVGNSVNLAPLFISNSAGAVTFVSSDPATGVIASGSTFVALKSGVVTITAFQAANGSYASGSKSAVITINGQIFELLNQAGNKLFGAGSIGLSAQGTSVSISNDGTTAIIGGPNDGSSQGAAWIFNYNGTSFIDSGTKLIGTGNTGTAHQGTAVSISSDGRTAIVGGATDNSNIGAAWIFTFNGSNFVQMGSKLVGSGNTGGSYQGYTVAISSDGKTAIVGGYQDNSLQGAAWIFTFNGTNFVQAGSKLVGSGGAAGDRQGLAVNLSSDGTTAIVGGPNNSTGQGAAWIYTFNGINYVQVGTKLVGSGNIGAANQGTSVNLSSDGHTAIIGGLADNSNIGASWIYTFNGTNYVQVGSKLTGSGNVGAASVGSAVSLSSDGNTAVVGGFADNSNAGAVWVYTYNGSNFVQAGNKLTGTGGFGTPKLGSSVSISSNARNVISGGSLDNGGQGAVWVFQYLQPQTITGFNPIPGQQLATGTYNIPGVLATSGLPVTFTSSNLLIATISGTTITFLTAGVDTITAFQPGDNVYAPATPVSQVLAIVPDKPPGNRGLYFDGVNNTFSTGVPTTLTDNITIETWVKLKYIPSTHIIVINNGNTSLNGYGIIIDSTLQFVPFAGAIGGISTGYNLTLNKWTHLALVIQSGIWTAYADGIQVASQPWSDNTPAGSFLFGSNGTGGQFFNGQIDEVRVFETARTVSEIVLDMGSSSANGAVAYWNMDDDLAAGNQTIVVNQGTLGAAANATLPGSPDNPLWTLRVTDNTDNASAGLGSLRQAIAEANTDFDTDYIDFSIQQNNTTSTISLTSAFPDISNPAIIDGYSANGSSANTALLASGNNAVLRVELNCAVVTTNSFNMTLGASAIKGLSMYSHVGSPYIISYISNLLFNGNFVGLRADGSMATGSSNGVYIAGGSAVTLTGNVIVNQSSGISIYSSNSLISGNLVGVQPTGWVEVSNGEGIINFTGTNNTISGNVIASSGYNLDLRGTGTIVKGNYIGTDPSGTLSLGTPSGAGILIQGETNSTIGGISVGEGNVIANNSNYGLWIQTGSGNKISGNSVYGNIGANGIQLNAGANGDKPAPLITAANPSMITGTCQAGDIVEVFNDNNSIGSPNQGRTYLGIATNIAGNWSYAGTFTLGDRITATATDVTNGTSPFATAFTVTSPIIPTMPVGNRGMYFNGAGDHVAVNNPVQNDFTIEFWMKTTQPGNPGADPHWFYGFGLVDGDAGSYDYGVSMADGKIRFGSGDFSFDYTAESVTLVNDNKWHHVAVTRQSTGPVAMFIDGNPETLTGNTTQVVGALSGTPTLKIGKIQSNQFPYKGQLDEIKIFNTIRSASEIISDMSGTATGTAGLVSYWDFEDDAAAGDQTIAVDVSSNTNDGTLMNGPLWTLRVTDMTDNTGSVGSLGSLRQAINEANMDTDTDYIDFSMPSGTQTIGLTTTCSLDNPVFIDGFTQLNTLAGENSTPNGANFGQPINAKLNVVINGSLVGGSDDGISINSSNNLIRGLVFNGFANALASLAWNGTNTNSTISGCFFGTDRNGAIAGLNANQVTFQSSGSFSQNVIGGYSNADRNLIGSGASAFSNFANSTVTGNYFGTDATGINYLGDASIGFTLSSSNVFDGNVIANKLQILNSNSYIISNNIFGTKADGTGYLSDGGAGINLGNVLGSQPSSNHLILNNTIANRAIAIQISKNSINNTISGNNIYNNTLAGIYLTGLPAGNNNKAAPAIISATTAIISGTCAGGDLVEVFDDTPQYGSSDQGRSYLGTASTVGTNWSFQGTLTLNERITATATDGTNGTSAFSIARIVASPGTLTGVSLSGSNLLCAGSAYQATIAGAGTFTGGNEFTLELSDNLGNFATPIFLTSFTGVLPDTIVGITIPGNSLDGSLYLVRVSATNPLTTISSLQLTVTNLNFTGLSSTLSGCAGTAFALQSPTFAGANYSWSGTSGSFNNAFIYNPTVSGALTGTQIYTSTITKNSCTAIPYLTTLVVNALPVLIYAFPVPPYCIGVPQLFNVGGADVYTWTGNAGISALSNTTTGTSTFTPLSGGIYDISITGLNTMTGCASTAIVGSFTISGVPSITGFNPATLIIGQTVTVIGANLGMVNIVTFTGGVTAVPSSAQATKFEVVVPSGAFTGIINVGDWCTVSGSTTQVTLNGSNLYRSVSSGNWNVPSIWQNWDGSAWQTTSNYPGEFVIGDLVSISGSNNVNIDTNIYALGGLTVSGVMTVTSSNLSITGKTLIVNNGKLNVKPNQYVLFQDELRMNDIFDYYLNETGSTTELQNGIVLNSSVGGTNLNIDGDLIFSINNQTISGTGGYPYFNGNVTISGPISVTDAHSGASSNDAYVGWLNGTDPNSTFILAPFKYLNYLNTNMPMQTGILDASASPCTFNYVASGDQYVKPAYYFSIQSFAGDETPKRIINGSMTVNGLSGSGGQFYLTGPSDVIVSITGNLQFYNSTPSMIVMNGIQNHQLIISGASSNINPTLTISSGINSSVIYNAPFDQEVFMGQYTNLIVDNAGVKFIDKGNISATNLSVTGGATLDTRSHQITGNVAGQVQMDAGTTLILGESNLTSAGTNFPINYNTANIKLDAGSTVVYESGLAQTVSNVPAYGNLVLTTSGIKSNLIGSLTVTGSMQIGSGVTYLTNSDITLGGDLTDDGTFTQSALKRVTMNGSSDQSITGVSLTQFRSLSLNKPSGDVWVTKDISIADELNFNTGGSLAIGSNTVTFQQTASISGIPGSTKMIRMDGTGGQVLRNGLTNTDFNFLYPVGTGSLYTPVSLSGFNAVVVPTAQFGVRLINTSGGINALNKIYELNSANISNISSMHLDFAFDPSEVNASPNTVFRYNPNQNSVQSPYIDLIGNHFGVNGSYTNAIDGQWILQSSTTITGLVLSSVNLCAGGNYIATITGTGSFNAGNTFGLELSQSNGSFPGTQILSWTNINPNTIIGFTLPSGLASGTNYKIRTLANTPSLIGQVVAAVTITGIPTITNLDALSVFPGNELTIIGTNLSSSIGVILTNGNTINGFNTVTSGYVTQVVNGSYTTTGVSFLNLKIFNSCSASANSMQVLTVWPVHATSITLFPTASIISTSGGNMLIGSSVLPIAPTAAAQIVTWSVLPANGLASIDGTGVLQAINDGVVTIVCTSVSDPTVTGIFVITIVGQTPQVITTSNTILTHLCHGQVLSVSFTKTGSFLPGAFIAEIYNGVSTVQIGSLDHSPINTTIPGGLFGTDFRIRVKHSVITNAILLNNGSNITVAGIPVLTTLPVQNICSGATTNITFSGTQNPYVFTWNLISATVGITGVYSGIGTELQQTIDGSGTLLFSVTGSNGCISSPVNLTINVHDIPTVDNPGIQGVCSGSLFTLTVTSPASGVSFTWTPTVTGSVTGSSMITSNAISQTLTGQGYVNYMIIPVANGCTGPGYNLEVGVSGTPDLSLGVSLPNGNNICSTEDMSVIVQGSQIGILYNAYIGSTSIADPTDGSGGNIVLTIPASSFTAGPNTISIKAASVGCGTGFLTSTGTVFQAASPDTSYLVSVSNASVCQGEDRAISLGGSQNGVLYAPFMSSVQVGPTIAGTGSAMDVGITGTELPSGLDVITIQVLSPGCTGYLPFSHSTTLTVQALPTVNPVFNTRNCSGIPKTIVLSSTPTGASFTWSLVGTNTTGNVTGQTAGGTGNIDQTLSGLGTVDYLVFPKIGVCAGTPKLITVRVNGQPNTSYPVKADSVCGGAQATVSVGNSELGVDYRLISVTGAMLFSVSGTGGPLSLTVPGGSLNFGSNILSLVGVGCVSQTFSPNPNLVVLSSPVSPPVSSILGTGATCDKQNITLSVPGTYSKYQWRLNNIRIAGEDSNAYVPVIKGNYSVEVYTGNNCFILSEIVPLEFTMNQIKPVITASGGNKDTLLVSSAATGYQWYIGKRAIVGADNQSYRPYFSAAYKVRINPKGKCSEYSDDYYLNNIDYDPLVRYDFEITDSTIVIDPEKLKLKLSELEISPNPASDKFSIRYKAHKRNSVLQLTMYNSIGSLVSTQARLTNDLGMLITEMERENLPSGIYKVVITDGDERVSANLVIR